MGLAMRRLSNKEMATAMRISDSTVKFHLRRVFAKLGVKDHWALQEKVNQQEQVYPSQLGQGLAHLSGAEGGH